MHARAAECFFQAGRMSVAAEMFEKIGEHLIAEHDLDVIVRQTDDLPALAGAGQRPGQSTQRGASLRAGLAPRNQWGGADKGHRQKPNS